MRTPQSAPPPRGAPSPSEGPSSGGAAPGDALEEEGLEAARVERGLQLGQGRGLSIGEPFRANLSQALGHRRLDRALLDLHPAPLHQPLHRRRGARDRAAQLVELRAASDREQVPEGRGLRGGALQCVHRRGTEHHRGAHHLRARLGAFRRIGQSRRQRGPQRLTERMPVVARRELDQRQHVVRERRCLLQHRRHRAEGLTAFRSATRTEVEAEGAPPAERDEKPLSALQPSLQLGGNQVGERPPHRTPDRHRGELLHRPGPCSSEELVRDARLRVPGQGGESDLPLAVA